LSNGSAREKAWDAHGIAASITNVGGERGQRTSPAVVSCICFAGAAERVWAGREGRRAEKEGTEA
jgi:hypothetical protein